MEAQNFLIYLVLILLSARLLGELAAVFNIPSVIGELIAGIILGPSVLELIPLTSSLQLLAQMGIIFLLFEVGLETDVHRLVAAGTKALIVAFMGVILPFTFGAIISLYWFHLSLLASLFIGSTLTATSIGITLRVLKDLKKQNSSESQIILGAAVLDDIIGIVMLAILYEFSVSNQVDLWHATKVMFFIAIYFFTAPLFVKGISQIIKHWDNKSTIPGILPAVIVSLILFFSWLAHAFGAPELLGGFAAGLALSKRFFFKFSKYLQETPDFTERVEHQMQPIIHLFTPIFFVSIGLSLNLKIVNWGSEFIWLLTGSLLTAAILGKLFSGFVLPGESIQKKCVIGTAMIPRGEVGLVFANIGLTSAVITNDIYASLILVITLTTLCAPFALRSLYKRAKL